MGNLHVKKVNIVNMNRREYNLNAIPINIPDLRETVLKFVWNYKTTQITIAMLRKKSEGVKSPDFKLYNKAI